MLELASSSPPLTTASTASAEASTVSSSANHVAEEHHHHHHHQQQLPSQPPLKKKRNQPGMPDPDAEVVALSPKTLMATNRFVCEICGKGFQRDQNLQLHRRGHNLPWKLRQRGTKEVKKRVYVCPETSCVHHDPKRALGDLTGIKKHFCRKHGEKKWKCERCSKKYAVQSDWKAHMKTCGTKEYRCDCGTVFSRRDSFVTHRAFCDALAQETVKVQVQVQDNGDKRLAGVSAGGELINGGSNYSGSVGSPPGTVVTPPSSSVRSPVLSIQSSEAQEASNTFTPPTITASADGAATATNHHAGAPVSSTGVNGNVVFGSIFAPLSGIQQQNQPQASQFSSLMAGMSSSSENQPEPGYALASPLEPPTSASLSLSSLYQFSQNAHPLFNPAASSGHHRQFSRPLLPQPAMSATALLQKAAQMGATASPSSLLWGFGLSSGDANQVAAKNENGGGLVPGLPSEGNYMATGPLMSGPNGLFAARPTTLDLLGLGIGPSNGSPNGLSSLLGPYNGGLDMGSFGTGESWEGPPESKPNQSVP